MSSLQSRVCVASLVAIVGGWAAIALASPRQGSPAPHAITASLSHDFGSIQPGSKVNYRFTIRNAGAAALTVTRLSLSQPGMTGKMKPSVLPGEEAALTIEWNPAGAKGAVEGKVVLEVNDPERPRITFVLTAVVEQTIEFVPYQAVYASVYKGEVGRRSVRIVNHRERPLLIGRLEAQGEHFQAAVTALEPGKRYELSVTVPSTVAPGRYSEAVFLYTDDPNVPRLMVPVNVLVKPDVYANPDTLDFGRVTLKDLGSDSSVIELLTQSLMVRRRAGQFSITRLGSDVPFVTVRRSPEGEASSEGFRIDVSLIKDRLRPGPFSGSIRIGTDDRQFPEVIVSVRGEIQ